MGALKKFRFSNEEQPPFYFYNVDTNLGKLEIVQEGIPTYIGYPKREFAKNSFANLILSTPLVDLESLILKHLRLLAINDINKEREVLFRMKKKIEAYKISQLLFLINPFNIITWIYLDSKAKKHFDEFNRITNKRLNYLSDFAYSSFDSEENPDFALDTNQDDTIRIIHEFDQILRANKIEYTSKTHIKFREQLAELLQLNTEDPIVKNKIKDTKGNFLKTMKESQPKNWLVMKGLTEIRSK